MTTRDSYARSRLSDYTSRSSRAQKAQRDHAATIVPALAARSYHIPGNTYCADWYQYIMNNHPVFGICFHDKLHPLGIGRRIVALIGSIAFGLAITNIFYLSSIREDLNEPFVSITIGSNATSTGTTNNEAASTVSGSQVTITYGMILLWTVGGSLHSCFDLSVWYLSACACYLPGGSLERLGCCTKLGSSIVVIAVVIVVAVASFVVVLRASVESSNTDPDIDNVQFGRVEGVESFEFLLSYSVELALALFVYYPLWGTILFSGVLGCGRLPFLGGRPREIWLEEKKNGIQQSVSRETTETA